MSINLGGEEIDVNRAIVCDVPNTGCLMMQLDDLTRSKGVAVLRQLMYLVTPKVFGRACGQFLRKNECQTGSLDALLQELSIPFEARELGFTLRQWKSEWVELAGANEVECCWDPEETQSISLRLPVGFVRIFLTLR